MPTLQLGTHATMIKALMIVCVCCFSPQAVGGMTHVHTLHHASIQHPGHTFHIVHKFVNFMCIAPLNDVISQCPCKILPSAHSCIHSFNVYVLRFCSLCFSFNTLQSVVTLQTFWHESTGEVCVHSLSHLLTCSLTHSLTHSLACLLTHSTLAYSLTRSLTHSLNRCVHPGSSRDSSE